MNILDRVARGRLRRRVLALGLAAAMLGASINYPMRGLWPVSGGVGGATAGTLTSELLP